MTIDEAIKHCEEKAEELRKQYELYDHWDEEEEERANGCLACAAEHEQLAKWLEELVELRRIQQKGEIRMRSIDAEALKEVITANHYLLSARNNSIDYGMFTTGIMQAIDNAPTVPLPDFKAGYKQAIIDGKTNFSRPQGEWIPVSERLPDEKPSGSAFGFDFEEVLCTTIWEDVRSYKFGKPIGHDKSHFWFCGEIMDGYVIAWQYKPEPYKKGEEE